MASLSQRVQHAVTSSAPVRRAMAFGAMALAGVLALAARGEAESAELAAPMVQTEPRAVVPNPAMLRLLSLGHHEAFADLLWLNALSFFGANHQFAHRADWLNPFLDAIVELDPRFRLVYEWAGTVIMYGGRIDNDSVRTSTAVLERGIEHFPLDWRMHMMLGVNWAVEMAPSSAEERAQWRLIGGRYFARAASMPNAPSYLVGAAAHYLPHYGAWYDSLVNASANYLDASESLQVRGLRRRIETDFVDEDRLLALGQRQIRLSLEADPDIAFGPWWAATVIHPDPVYRYSPAVLAPPPFHLTR